MRLKIEQTNIHGLSGIQTRDPSNEAALDVRLRPDRHQDRKKKGGYK